MARHEITIHENATRTRETTPYLGTYLPKEAVRSEKFAAAIAAKSGLPAIQVQAVLDGCFEAIEELEKEALARVHLDGMTVMGVITGAFPEANSPFDPKRNKLLPVLRLNDAIRFSLTDETPAILTAADLTRLRIDNMADVASPRPYNLIRGTRVFRVAGYNMVHTDAGSAAYLQNPLGVTFPLTVDEVVSKQLFTAHLAAALEPGDYRLVVKSRAGDAEGPLQTAFRNVKYLKVEGKRHLSVDDLDVSGLGEGMCRLKLSGIRDPYAVKGCTGSERFFHFAAKVYWNGEELGEKEFGSEGEGFGIADFEHPIAEGETVKVVLEIDPAKTDYDQTPVEVVKTI